MNPSTGKYKTSLIEKLGMYTSLLDFRYKNLCIKTHPEALLPIEVEAGAIPERLEDIAQVGIIDDEKFLVIPNNQSMMSKVCQAFIKSHPQLKQEVVQMDISDDLDPETKAEVETQRESYKQQTGEDLPPIYALILTTPEVDDNMKDTMDKSVDALEKQCEVKYQKELIEFKSRMAISLASQGAEDLDKANSELDDIYNNCWKQVEEITESMHSEIADANIRYHKRKDVETELPNPHSNMSNHDQEAAFTYKFGAPIEE